MSRELIAVCATALACVALGVYGLLSVYQVNTAQFLSLFATTAAPLILIFYNILKTDKVERQTNGPLTILSRKVDYLWEQEKRRQEKEDGCGG